MKTILFISYDNGSYIPFFPLNLAYLSEAVVKSGENAIIWNQDLHHGTEASLTDLLNRIKIDAVGFGFCAGYYQYKKAKQISAAVNASYRRKDFAYILGGHGPAAAPEFFLQKLGADYLIVGDGEKALSNLLRSLSPNNPNPTDSSSRIILGEPTEDDSAPIQTYERMGEAMNIYRLIRWPLSKRTDFCFPVLSSRGCRWNCSFCYRMREGFHERTVEAIIEELKWLHNHLGITHFQFADELLMNSEDRTVEISQMLKPLGIKWMCNGRLNYAKPVVLREMKDSGCVFVNYGIEAFDDTVLKNMNKSLTKKQIIDGVEATLEAGLTPGLNIIWGNIGDTVKTLWAGAEFLKKYNEWGVQLRTIRPVTPYPGSELFKCAVENGLIKNTGDFYENLHKNSDLASVQFTGLSNDEFHHCLSIANGELIDRYLLEKHWDYNTQRYQLYEKNDTSFRGFRQT